MYGKMILNLIYFHTNQKKFWIETTLPSQSK